MGFGARSTGCNWPGVAWLLGLWVASVFVCVCVCFFFPLWCLCFFPLIGFRFCCILRFHLESGGGEGAGKRVDRPGVQACKHATALLDTETHFSQFPNPGSEVC